MVSLVDRLNDDTAQIWSEALSLGEMIANDSSIQQLIREPLPLDKPRLYAETLLINSRLSFTQQYRDRIFAVNVIGANGGIYKSTFHTQLNEDLRKTWWYETIIGSNDPVWFAPHEDSFATQTSGNRLITIGIPIKDKASDRRIGVVLVDIEENTIQEVYKTRLIDGGVVLLLDKENKIITYPMESGIDPISRGSYDTLINSITPRLKGMGMSGLISASPSNPLYVYRFSELNNWQTVGIIPFKALTKDSAPISWFIWISVFTMIALAFILSIKFSKKIANPIKNLKNTMQLVETGDLEHRADIMTPDELGQLAASFNHMVEKLDYQINLEIENQKALRKSELRALQAQINPHFLYNTLDSISWLTRDNDVRSVEKMIDALSNFYRIGISRGKDVISVEDEIKHVESYLMIQKTNYAHELEYEIDVPEQLHKFKTIKLILQPIVENAIYHGIKKREGVGIIHIKGIETNDALELSISDNGVGMNSERLAELNRALENLNTTEIDAYGILNVQERIRLFFGEQYGLRISSEPGKGTTVFVRIPKLQSIGQVSAPLAEM
jgi:two-component system sensor histidine kinase YesM